jgi:hypothetical protein
MNSKWLIRSLVLLATVSLVFFIYRYFFGYQTTETGLKYRFLKGKPLETVLSSDNYCLLNYMIIGPGNDTIFNSYNADTLVEVPYPSDANNELTEALQMASSGSKLEVIIPTDSLKKKVSSHYKVQLLPDNQEARVIFEVSKIMSSQDYFNFISEKAFQRAVVEQKLIEQYCGKGWFLDTATGIRYRKLASLSDLNQDAKSSSMSKNVNEDQSGLRNLFKNAPFHKGEFSLEYEIVMKRLNGDLIYDSKLEGKKYFTQWDQQINPVTAMNEFPFWVASNSTMEFVVPSKFGFGAAGRIGVPAYSPLYVKIYGVKPVQR